MEVRTSRDFLFWEREAAYDYYRHGPLARTVLGQNQVQGLDYAYTLQGWLKGVNSIYALPNSNGCAEGTAFENLQINDRSQNGSPAAYRAKTSITFEPGFETGNQDFLEAFIDPAAAPCTITSETLATGDMGKDGTDSLIAKDAFGFTLHYFDENTRHDYIPIGASSRLISVTPPGFNFASLYNGNIGAMSVNIPQVGNPMLYNYRYDQLNRLKSMNAFTGLNSGTNSWEPISTEAYRERINYDPNGNILNYNRHGDVARISMDSLLYSYKPNTNQLDKVIDEADDAAVIDYPKYNDLKKGQVSGNYQYDAIGNLIKDASEGITDIQWNVYGKIKSITKAGSNISYTYDASGNRISKTAGGKTTYYVRDANGNVMSVYEQNTLLKQTEIHLYGSSRLGIYNVDIDVQSCPSVSPEMVTFIRGNKFFELSNHLGNVLATVSDKKIGFSNNGNNLDYYKAEVVSAQDYYPFGMLMPGRKYSIANTDYRYGFNGKEMDKETSATTTYDYGFRIYNPGLGRFLSVDPLQIKHHDESPYLYAGANPIAFSDPDGRDRIISTTTIFDFGEGNVVSFISKKIVKEDFIISQKKNQNGTVHYLYMDTYEQHVNYNNGATGEQKNFSQISYPVRIKSNYDTRNWTGKVGMGWGIFKDWFNNLVKEGHEGYHEGGGIMFTSKLGQGTDRGPKRKFIDATPVNIDLMVETIGQLKTTAGYERNKDIINILERFSGKIGTAINLREEIEKMKKGVVNKTLEPMVLTPTERNSLPVRGSDPVPDSIWAHAEWNGRTKDGTQDSNVHYIKQLQILIKTKAINS